MLIAVCARQEYKKYCQMVISTIKLNIAHKLQQDLTPDDYQYLLSLHTEEVSCERALRNHKKLDGQAHAVATTRSTQ